MREAPRETRAQRVKVMTSTAGVHIWTAGDDQLVVTAEDAVSLVRWSERLGHAVKILGLSIATYFPDGLRLTVRIGEPV